MALLLGLLDAEPAGLADFYSRYHTLQVFKGLAAAAPLVLQQAILGAPLGVTRLMDLLNEQEVGAGRVGAAALTRRRWRLRCLLGAPPASPSSPPHAPL